MKISSYIKNASWFATLGAVILLSAQMGEARAQGICDRTTEVRTVIIAEIPGNPACGDVTTIQLAAVNPAGGLTIDSLDSPEDILQIGDFAGLSGLRKLNLTGNSQLSQIELPAGLFTGLSALTTLDMSINGFLRGIVLSNLVALPAGLFTGLNELTTLDLSFNFNLGQIALPAGLFNGLSKLTTLDLSNNASLGFASALPDGLFNDLSALTTLDMFSTSLGRMALPAGLFTGLSNLTTLNLSNNSRLGTALPVGLFNSLSALTTLNLTDNFGLGQTALPAGLFNGLSALTTLDLFDTSLGQAALPAGLFNGLSALTTLNLSGDPSRPRPRSRLGDTVLPAGLFTGLNELTTLDLSNNPDLQSSDLSNGIFDNVLDTLTDLRLDDGLAVTLAFSAATLSANIPQNGNLDLVVAINRALPFAVRVPYDAIFGGADSRHFTGGSGMLDFAAGSTDDQAITITAAANAPLNSSITISLDTPVPGTTVGNTFTAITHATEAGGAIPAAVLREFLPVTGNNDRILTVGTPVDPTPAPICDRTDDVITAILEVIGSGVTCETVNAEQLAAIDPGNGLTIDSLDSAGEDILRVGDFAGLSGLRRLNLSGNSELRTLPTGLFNDLSALTTLNLSDNRHLGSTTLSTELFNGLSALTTLDLSGNDTLGRVAATLPAELFNDLSALATLDLSGGGLGTVALSAGLFNGLSMLTTLDLSGNRNLGGFAALPAELFNSLSELATLDLSDNLNLGRIALPAGLFNGLSALTTLDLSDNDQLGNAALPTGLFNGLNVLTTLDLSGNRFLDYSDLPDGIFHDALNTLTNLQLDDRLQGVVRISIVASDIDAIGVTDITVTRTAPYTAVNVAYTAAYGGGAEDAHFTGETGALEFAAGQTSTIINITSSGPPFNSAVTITLGALRLPADMRAVPSTANVAEIVAVDPANNVHTLTVIQGICNRTAEVQTVIRAAIPGNPACGNVTANQLADVNPAGGLTIDSLDSAGDTLRIGDFANLSGLTTLNLSGNEFLGSVALPDEIFNGLSNLTTLNLSGNSNLGSVTLPDEIFNDLNALTTLNLSGNSNLGSVALPDEIFNGLSNLTTLNLSGNSNLGNVALPAELFNSLSALTTLDLSGNQNLGRIVLPANLFNGLSNLTTLNLSGNSNLGSVALPAGLFNALSNLTTLNLSGNSSLGSVALSAGLFNALSNLTTLNLSGNSSLGSVTLPAGLFNALSNLTTLDLSGNPSLGSVTLPAGLFNGLSNLTTLNLSDTSNLQSNDLSNGIFDDVLDTLTDLRLDNRLGVTLAFSVATPSANIPQNGNLGLVVAINPTLPFAVRVPYNATFSGGADGNDFTGENGMLDFAAGNTAGQTITITAVNAPSNSSITITLGTPVPGTTVGNTFTAITHATGAGGAIPAAVLREFLPVTNDNDRTLTVGAPVDVTTPAPICDRTDDVVTAILTAIGGSVMCQDVTAEQLAAIDPGNGLTIDSLDSPGDTLQVGDFAGLSGLRRLNLSGNAGLGSTALSTGLFNGLSELTTLDLSGNSSLGSTALSTGLFNGLSELTTLDLSGNSSLGSVALSTGLFNGLNTLTTLDLSDNLMLGSTALSTELFNGLSELTTLDLSGNNALTRLPAGIFDDVLDTLTVLDIDDRLKGSLSFSGPSEVLRGGTAEIVVRSSLDFVTVSSTINVTFSGGGTANFSGPSTTTFTFDSDKMSAATTVTASPTAAIGATAAFAFDTITLLDGDGRPSSLPTDSLIVSAASPAVTLTVTFIPAEVMLAVASETGNDATIVEVDAGDGPDDTATITLTVRNVPVEVTAIEITYNLEISGAFAAAGDIAVVGASVGTGLRLRLGSLGGAATASTVITTTARNDDDTDDETVKFTVTGLSFIGADFANRTGLSDNVTITVDDNDGGICDRTDEVKTAILEVIGGGISCANALPRLGLVSALTLTGVSSLQTGDFDDLIGLVELNLSGNNALTRLPAGIFDNVLGTLTTLTLDAALKATVSIEPNTSFIAPSTPQTLSVQLTTAVPATVRLTLTAGGAEAGNITLPDPATVTLPAGMTSTTFDITLTAEAAGGNTGTVTLSAPVLLYVGTNGRERQNTHVADSLVNLDPAANTHTLTVMGHALQLRVRVFLEGSLQ